MIMKFHITPVFCNKNLNSILSDINVYQPGVDFINCFGPYAHLLRLTPNFHASKKLLKSWAYGAKVGHRGAKPFMKSTPGDPCETLHLQLFSRCKLKNLSNEIDSP